MRKITFAKFFWLSVLIAMSSCGGGGSEKLDLQLNSSFPPKMIAYLGELVASATIVDEDASILSAKTPGTKVEKSWLFELEPLSNADVRSLFVSIEFSTGKAGIVIAKVFLPLSDMDSENGLFAVENDYDMSIDYDEDGLFNIDEISLGTNPEVADTDGDGFADGIDVFPSVASEWADSDGDGIGDNAEEEMRRAAENVSDDAPAAPDETDIDTGPADADGDGVPDVQDDCPTVSDPYQEDADNDGSGDVCDPDIDGDGVPNTSDNCPYAANVKQQKEDKDKDGVAAECDLDDYDAGVGDDRSAVFANIAHGNDSARGTKTHPVASIARAATLARTKNMTVYAAAGEYDVATLELNAGLKIYGGFENSTEPALRFKTRDVRDASPIHKTVIVRSDIPVTLIASAGSIAVDGFYIENRARVFDEVEPSSTVRVSGGSLTLSKNNISGNSSSVKSTAILITNGELRLDKNRVDGGGLDEIGSESFGVVAREGTLLATNNIISGGRGRFVSGADLCVQSALLVNNTIAAHSLSDSVGTAEGVGFSCGSLMLVNNIVLAEGASERDALVCRGAVLDASSKFLSNLYSVFPHDPWAFEVRNCDGTGTDDANARLGDATVSSNVKFSGAGETALLDDGFALLGAGGINGIDDGTDASIPEYGEVSVDYHGKARPAGAAFDIGAVETR